MNELEAREAVKNGNIVVKNLLTGEYSLPSEMRSKPKERGMNFLEMCEALKKGCKAQRTNMWGDAYISFDEAGDLVLRPESGGYPAIPSLHREDYLATDWEVDKPIAPMTFMDAVQAMEDGKKVRRRGSEVILRYGFTDGNATITNDRGKAVLLNDARYIMATGHDGICSYHVSAAVYLASPGTFLATDWEIVE